MTMNYSRILALCGVVALSGCNLFNTADSENSLGRGAKFFSPYESSASGAIALSLLQLNGCAILPNGEPVSPGSVNVPNYPAECADVNTGAPLQSHPPTAKMTVKRGQLYFLNQFAAVDTAFDVTGTDYQNPEPVLTWARKLSRFKDLDWSGVTQGQTTWRPGGNGLYEREIFFDNAAWMLKRDSKLLVEVMDADGNIRASTTYDQNDLLAENPISGRSRVSWFLVGMPPPTYPGDTTGVPMGDVPFNQAVVKVAYSTSTNPINKSFRMPDISGEGRIRVTWSELPQHPFNFPVTFVSPDDQQPTCYKTGADGFPTDETTQCGFGLKQDLRFNAPQSGDYYQPGETVDFRVVLKDDQGNALHSKEHLPSMNDYLSGNSNGLLYFNSFMILTMKEQSASESGFMAAGPLQDFKLSDTELTNYFRYPDTGEPEFYVQTSFFEILPGAPDSQPNTRYSFKLPDDAKPGTYVVYLKGHRSFMGERLNRLDAFFFQVGQKEVTAYPNRVGNCQICHNQFESMNNVMHGLSVDNVEGCKSCHNSRSVGQTAELVHKIHFLSQKYPQNKADCTMCHLSKSSATTPSLVNCQSCHPATHGIEYFNLNFSELAVKPNAYGNCANACHVVTPPSRHILPGK